MLRCAGQFIQRGIGSMDDSKPTRPETPGQLPSLLSNANWSQLMRQAALCVLGEPARRHRGEWRYRSRGSLVVHVDGPRAGTWKDFEGDNGGGVLDFLEHFLGLDHARAFVWLAGSLSPQSSHRTIHRPGPAADAKNLLNLVRALWAASVPIPTSSDHPARRWLIRRKLWWPSLPLPPAVRWLDARGPYTGSGSIIALAAPPSAWADAWPQLPTPAAVQILHLDSDGRPALDRPVENGGLAKRTFGLARGAVLIIGSPVLSEALTPARVAEGLADTLALASRHEGPVICMFGTSGLRRPTGSGGHPPTSEGDRQRGPKQTRYA